MVTLFKRPGAEEGLDARIAGLSRVRSRVEPEIPQNETAPAPVENAAASAAPEPAAPAPPPAASLPGSPASTAPPASGEDALAVAREELVARLSAEIRPERRALLSRSDLAKLVSGAVQAYFVRHAI
jgi:hypothetical protein